VQAHEGTAQVTAVRSLLAAAICACVLGLVPGAALAHDATPNATSPVQAAPAAGDDLQAGGDLADRPELGGVSVKRQSRKPRRTNRRLRTRSGDTFRSGSVRTLVRARTADQLNLKSKRHRAKRALMRRLMAVRGGLQA
jgi:hypothetical protein